MAICGIRVQIRRFDCSFILLVPVQTSVRKREVFIVGCGGTDYAAMAAGIPRYASPVERTRPCDPCQLVDCRDDQHRGAPCDQPVTHPVQGLEVKLIIRLDRHEAHVVAIHRLRNHFCIEEVVLVRLHERLHELSRNELYVMTLFAERTPQKVGTRTCLHPNQGGLQVGCESDQLLLSELLLQQNLAVIAERYGVNVVLPRSMPTERICMSMILLQPAFKILHTVCEVQAADHLSSRGSKTMILGSS